jgi:acyl carrier protein
VERQEWEEREEQGSEQGSEERTPIQELVAGIWSEVLEVDQVHVEDNFFALGGHSLLATQVVARLQAIFQIEISLRSLFEVPTIRLLAARVEQELQQAEGRKAPALQRASREQPLPLSFAQQRLWYLYKVDPASSAYILPLAIKWEGELGIASLEQSFGEIIQRHEVLRTTFQVVQGQPVQIIKPGGIFLLPLVDLRHIPDRQREDIAKSLVQQESRIPFDLARGPLLRARLLRLEAREHILLLSMHHIVSDGWSMSILVHEVGTLYNAFVSKSSPALPDLPIQYVDFAVWQRQWLQGETLSEHLHYWLQQLNGLPLSALPTDRPRSAKQSSRGASYNFVLPASLSTSLSILSRQEGATLFMVLLTAFQTLLYRYTGQTDIVLGTDIANRTLVETEALIGFFVNILVLRANLSGSPGFQQALRHVREVVLGAYMHQNMPFEMLVEHLRPQHTPDRMPLVQALFVLQNTPGTSKGSIQNATLRPVANDVVHAKFDLALFMYEASDGLHGGVTYSADLFDAQTIATMMDRFKVLLQNIVAQPDVSIDVLDISTPEDRIRQEHERIERLRRIAMRTGERIELSDENLL